MVEKIECTSCHRNVITEENFVKFMCPLCGKAEIVRCEKCRKLSIIYKCPECGFEGP
ncbi:MAG: zinc finger domain-containing protein [Candidatus Aenigmatarchaeota archaeon]